MTRGDCSTCDHKPRNAADGEIERRYAVWPPRQEPDNRGRRAEKDAIALAKAEAKRQRKAAKRLWRKVGADDTALERPNAEVSGAGTASAGLPGYAPTNDGERK